MIVNVATVRHLSPFRYPGGKTWLVPRIRQWVMSLSERPVYFIEPFTGGGIVGLTVAFESFAEQVILVELDEQVAAVWETILGEDVEWLAGKIIRFDLTREAAKELLTVEPANTREKAFQTIVRNRVNRGGILASGAGMVKAGEEGKGIRSRWYPETLKKRILAIAENASRLTFIHGDGIETIRQYARNEKAVFFIDPPYVGGSKKAGRRLYAHWEVDHHALFELMSTTAGDFLLTYANDENIRQLADQHGFDTEAIAMKNTHHARMTELLISRDLSWLRKT